MSGRVCAAVVLVCVGSSAVAQDTLAAKLDAVIDGPDYKHAHWGVLVADAETGEPLYARNADKLFAPASVTKLFSCAAALVALGPDHRFVTPVHRRGDVSDFGTLRGDLILVAQGDLTFGGRTDKTGKVVFKDQDHTYAGDASTDHGVTDTDPRAAFDALAKQVKAAGIARVDGDVFIDDRLFASATSTGSGPRAVGPMIVNDNVIDLVFTPGKRDGDPVTVTVRPETGYVRADLDVRTGPKGQTFLPVKESDPRNLVVRGVVPAGGKPVLKVIPVENPAELARVMFIEALRRAGVGVTASALSPLPDRAKLPSSDEVGKLPKVASFTSPPLKEALTVTLKVSHNLYASTLPLLVGKKRAGTTTLSAGLREQGKVLKELGVDVGAMSFGGGAGGANADRATPRATVQLVRAMRKRSDWDAYKAALPVLGVDGTLATVVGSDSPARGKVFAKTGTLFWDDSLNGRSLLTSKALAGVMTTKEGRELAFAVFVNDVPLPKGTQPTREGKVLGKLAEIVYENCP